MIEAELERATLFDLDEGEVDWDLLAPDELGRADRFLRDVDRHRYAAGRAALRRLLGERTGAEPAAIDLRYGRYGRPFLVDGPSFNVSHAGRWCVIAIDDTNVVGVDIEDTTRPVEIDAVARRVFSYRELEGFVALDRGDRRVRFFELWTAKEAVLKALGTGFSTEPSTFSCETEPRLRVVMLPDGLPPVGWELARVPAPPGFMATLALGRSGEEAVEESLRGL